MGDIYVDAIKKGLERGEQTENSIREAFHHLCRVSNRLNEILGLEMGCRFRAESLHSEGVSTIKYDYEEFLRISATHNDPYSLTLECFVLRDEVHERVFHRVAIEDVLCEILSDLTVGRTIRLLVEQA
jgi:hypothetical protein